VPLTSAARTGSVQQNATEVTPPEVVDLAGLDLIQEGSHARPVGEVAGVDSDQVRSLGVGFARSYESVDLVTLRVEVPGQVCAVLAGRPSDESPCHRHQAPVQAGLFLEVIFDHHPHELLEVDLRFPTELLVGFGRVADQQVDLGRTHEAGILLDVLLQSVMPTWPNAASSNSRMECVLPVLIT